MKLASNHLLSSFDMITVAKGKEQVLQMQQQQLPGLLQRCMKYALWLGFALSRCWGFSIMI